MKLTIDVPEHLRLGQALIIALQRSGDLNQEERKGSIEYIVTGQDLFYVSDEYLIALIEGLK